MPVPALVERSQTPPSLTARTSTSREKLVKVVARRETVAGALEGFCAKYSLLTAVQLPRSLPQRLEGGLKLSEKGAWARAAAGRKSVSATARIRSRAGVEGRWTAESMDDLPASAAAWKVPRGWR